MSEENQLRLLLIGLEPKAAQTVQDSCLDTQFEIIIDADIFMSQYDQWDDSIFNAIICGPVLGEMAASELAQVLVNQCPGTLKYYITYDTTKYEPRNLLKNGFSAAFAFPMDIPIFKKTVNESVMFAKRKERSFRTVRLLDIDGGDKLGFETFLYFPKNKKYIRYTSADQVIEEKKIDRLHSRQMTQLWVDHRDMNKFYQYSAKKLRDLGEGGVSSTEKQEKLKDCVRTLFNDIFDQSLKADFDQGREMVKQCESIISNYVTKGSSSNWYKKLLSSIGEGGDTYNHASNVSTFASLFAIGMGHRRPEDLAMAGLFHDIGMSKLPDELQNRHESELAEEEKATYYSHIEQSILMIKAKRLIIPDSVEKAILQHHERFSGHGWPKRLAGGRISEEAQILSFADQFDYLTRFEEGRQRVGPMKALEQIRASGSINPDILASIRRILEKESSMFKSA